MPLPFAPKPAESRVYDSLKGVRLDDVTPEQMDSLRESVFAQGIDGTEDEYRRLILLQMAANIWPSGAPIPGTLQIVTADGGTGASTRVPIFTPAEHEVWQVLDISAARTGSGTVNYYVAYEDASTYVPILDLSTSEGDVQFDAWPGATAFITSTCWIAIAHASGTVTGMTYKAAIVRVR